MGFYYISIFSIFLLGIVYAALLLIFRGIARLTRGMPGRKSLLAVVGLVFLVLPVAEEFWIAWNFGQACKDAGTFIYKKVRVEGFYDDTTHWWRELVDSKYEFVESRDNLYGTLWRVERVDDEIRHFRIDRPTARYHYRSTDKHAPVAHKIVKHQDVVLDTSTGDMIGRYTRFSRDAPWFYIALGKGDFSCDAPGRWPLTKGSFLIYRDVLEAARRK